MTPITPSALPNQVESKQDHPSCKDGDVMDYGFPENSVCKDAVVHHCMPQIQDNKSAFAPLKFHTAGGRSISISANALKLAQTLLGDLGSEELASEFKGNEMAYFTCENEKIKYKPPSNIKNVSFESSHENSFLNRNELEITSSVNQFCGPLIAPITSSALSKQLDSKQDNLSSNNGSCSKPPNEDFPVVHAKMPCSRMVPKSKLAVGLLLDISNYSGSCFENKSSLNGVKKRAGKRSSSSSFKRPRTSRFIAPLNCSSSNVAKSALPSTSVNCCGTRVSSRYPFALQRKKLKEFFGGPPGRFSMLENVPESSRYLTANNAENYKFHDTCSSAGLGPEAFQEMLLQCGALLGDTSEKWMVNHYKWIVWKLACLERCYPSEALKKFLTASNVLEELKYRYEREFNYGHRSVVKKILEGVISSSSMMILCVSAFRSGLGPRTDGVLSSSDLPVDGNRLVTADSNYASKIELTDGWYSLDAILDVHLSKQLIGGKLFIGQKLRVCGATLCGWIEPVSPLEASMVSLVLHINGTFRAHWADTLGLCKGLGTPLSFRCIKSGGGRVLSTLVGISRLYPVLYKEKLQGGTSIVRSERMEKRILHINSRRRSEIAEAIISELEYAPVNDNDSDEGAKISRILEFSAEPEVLMAGMSSEQLISISSYQAKQEALRQDNLHKKIEKAFEEAGLGSRDVTPFMRVRVTGLISIESCRKVRSREGLITIWNPTEKLKLDLVEGQIYSVSSLVPFSGSSDFLYLQTTGTSSEWICLPSTHSKKFKPFFIPRMSILLSDLGEVPLASEFDISAVVVHVGRIYISGRQIKQWIFVTDGSGGDYNSLTEDQHSDGLLAISFCSSIFGNDSLSPINQRLSGCTVGFCNLIKRARDQNNHLWVADATENSIYSICYNISCGSHLKEAADSASKWAKTSSLALQKLEKRILCITGDDGI